MPSSSASRKRQRTSRFARAVFLQLCLASAAATSSSSSSSVQATRRRLRQRSAATAPKPSSVSQEQQHEQRSGVRGDRHLQQHHGDDMPQTRIVNGRDALGSQEFPFFAQWYRGCGATLIHSDIILSAAHCYSDTVLDHRLRVEGDPSRKLLSLVDSRVHPEFNDQTNWINNNEYDFMVLKLEKPLPQVRPVQVQNPDLTYPLHDQEDLTIVGYGLTSEEGKVATTLQQATVQYHDDCSFASYRPEKVGYETMFCAHGTHNITHSIDSCQGDSGGPILRKTPQGYIQVGVTSWGEGCARPDAPGIYARTAVAYDWIQSQLCELSSVPPPHCNAAPEDDDDDDATASNSTSSSVDEADGTTSAELSSVQMLENTTTEITNTTVLRVNVHYDNFPQEISWALAEQDVTKNNKPKTTDPTFTLRHVSRRQPVSVRHQLVTQDIHDIEVDRTYRLEFYDTIAGDGIILGNSIGDNQPAAIEIWQLTTSHETTSVWDTTTNTSFPVQTTKLDTVSQLLWSHPGNFGEFVRATLDVV